MTDFKDDAQTWGADLIDATQRWATPVIERATAPLRSEVAQLKQENGRLRTQTARDGVMAALDADNELGHNWRQTNDNPAFIHWLEQPDDLSPRRRIDLLREAFDRGEARRVRAFFAAYGRVAVPDRLRAPAAAPLPFSGGYQAPAKRTPDGRPRSWSRQQIADFYRAAAKGKFDGHEAEKRRIEQEIVSAAQEHRVVDAPMLLSSDRI
jgi:hypothetical protein